ncbi:MAG TPA: glycosyltransferase family 4 protein [Thermoanaerobaculales bacterium]|nr:glycosyltransferase family 4 protein [Thermoanaerobaculales bacterium]HPA80139.1 glycosyltransferase family 4 protein [Thermoanaerobaculales bacterium]HQL30275.1 glycosyltransferase family 4 protein [Thermoanaerobaculales bacterium]HQN94960.1 glycosyltransferase family 4 protein [Thermoanaerobaculales bacterium]HQP42524.1 glycosyltransferase family 4 protein [Thermoanaerobaculales bacterium]
MHPDSIEPLQVVVLTHKPEAPSFRHRIQPMLPELAARGLEPSVEVLPSRPLLLRVLARRRRLGAAAAVVLAKTKLHPLEARLLRRWCRRVVYDFDDAVYTVRPRRVGHRPAQSPLRQWRFATLCGIADLVLACNETLAARARPHAGRVEVVPTPVDVERYPKEAPRRPPGRTLVWIGMPENLCYLELIRPALARLSGEFQDLTLRVISSAAPRWTDVPIELVPWSEAAEVDALRTADVGIMPLSDDDWSSGKCSFKLVQYMAAGLPCVASRVAMNCEVVSPGSNGYLAGNAGEWEDRLRAVLTMDDRGRSLGRAGRELAERRFDRRMVAPRTAGLVAAVARAQPQQ